MRHILTGLAALVLVGCTNLDAVEPAQEEISAPWGAVEFCERQPEHELCVDG